MSEEPIDVPSEAVPESQVPARIESGHISPLDMPAEQFRAGLERRGENRKSLMDWVRSALVEGTDYGPIHVVSKDKCSAGRYCKNKSHFSKPVLFKPGAEKICGMLGVTVTYPTLCDYEQAAISGVDIKNVILRCELISASGQVIAHGVGGRAVGKDYGDLNKTLKMCEKSAHIDATLRMAGLSEIFTQDLEDMVPKEDAPESPKAEPQQRKAATASQVAKPSGKEATEEQKGRFIAMLDPVRDAAIELFRKWKWIGPDQELAFVPLSKVPKTKKEFEGIMADIQAFMDGGEQAEEWRKYLMPWGKHKGTPLDDLEKPYLFGLWANYEVETEYKGKPKKPETIAKDQEFRDMLDEAGRHYEFEKGE